MDDKPVNHEEALMYAHLHKEDSNLARCYLELVETQEQARKEPSKISQIADEIELECILTDHAGGRLATSEAIEKIRQLRTQEQARKKCCPDCGDGKSHNEGLCLNPNCPHGNYAR